jgi:HTH-type transcriptional repressor of NAD biosynthesis genes
MENKTIGFIGGKFLPLHLGHVYAIIEAANRVDKLYVITTSSEKRDRELCARDGIKYIPANVRLSWLGEELADLENIKIINLEDDKGNEDYDWEDGARRIKEIIKEPISYIFSSEPSYGERFSTLYPEAKHIIIDNKRETRCISGTELRRDLYANWEMLPNCVRKYFTKRVAIVGTESCGKTTLAKQLAKFFNTNYVEEVGREYCERYSDRLTPEMFNLIAMEHFLSQDKKVETSNRVLFVDSEAVVTQYYLDMYFKGKKFPLIEEIVKLQNYDLVLYLEPDVRWVDDGWRFEGAEEIRRRNNEKLKRMFLERNIKFVTITGNYAQRFSRARNLVSSLFEKNNKPELKALEVRV